MPTPQLLASSVQYPFPHLVDQPKLFEARDEVVRGQEAPARVHPADEGLDADDTPRSEADLRLVDQLKLLLFHRATQGPLERVPRLRFFLHCAGEELIATASGRLGLIHRKVRSPQELG